MQYIIKLLAVLVCAIAIISPVTAVITNVSPTGSGVVSNSFQHDSNYMPWEYECILIAIGLVCLAISRIWETADDIFSAIAVAPLGLSAWFANYMTIEKTTTVVSSGTITVVNTQIITPNAYLSAVMVVATLAAVMNVIWVFFLKKTDEKTSGEDESQ